MEVGIRWETIRVKVGSMGFRILPQHFDPTRDILHPDVFEQTSNARDIRITRVQKLITVLENGVTFAGVWTVNLRDGKLRNIDCNHRHIALTNYLLTHPDNIVFIELHLFRNLTDNEEREEFTKCNTIIVQNTSDFLKQYKDTINIWKKIDIESARGNFPLKVSHKNQTTAIGLYTIVSPYITRDQIPYIGGFNNSAYEFIKTLQRWNQGDGLNYDGEQAYTIIRGFLIDYLSIFGDYSSTNKFWKTPVLFPVFRIWWDNKDRFKNDVLINELRKLSKGTGRAICESNWLRGGTRATVRMAVIDYIEFINGNKTSDKTKLGVYYRLNDGIKQMITGRAPTQ